MRSTCKENYLFPAHLAHQLDMVQLAKDSAKECGIDLIEGSYAYWPLPQFESSADIQMIHECGITVTGASTVPEQITAYMMGMKNVAFAAVTNPATGLADGWTHDGEENLVAARKCLDALGKTIFKIIEKFPFADTKVVNTLPDNTKPLRLK